MRLFHPFFLTMGFFLILSGMLTVGNQYSLFADGRNNKVQDRIQQIDEQISELKEMKRGYESRALRHENLAQMMQFQSEYTLEVRQHLQLAEQNREIAAKIQKNIDQLEEQKKSLSQPTKLPGSENRKYK